MSTPRQTPIPAPPPLAKMPLRLHVELYLREVFAGNSERTATLRWLDRNIRQPRRCQCGEPGTVTVTYPGGAWRGSTPPTWWRCEKHADVPLTVPWSGGRPLIDQSRDECSWSISSTDTNLVTDCGCGTHVGEKSRWPW